MNYRESLIAQIKHEEIRPVPYKLLFAEEIGELIDRHYGNQEWRKLTSPYINTVPAFSNSIQFEKALSDGSLKDIYGGVWKNDRNIPHLLKPALPEPDLKGFPMISAQEILTPLKKQALKQELEKNNQQRFSLLFLGSGIWDSYWYRRGFENALMDCVAEPEFFEELIDIQTKLILGYIDIVSDLAYDGILLADDWGEQNGILLGKQRWQRTIKPRMAEIARRVHETGKFLVIHCCGSIADIMPDIVEVGVDVIESVQPEAKGNDPYALKRLYGDRITFWGGLGSQSTIPNGTVSQLKQEIRNLAIEMGKGGGYILSPAKPLICGTPVENAIAILETFADQSSF